MNQYLCRCVISKIQTDLFNKETYDLLNSAVSGS